MTCISASALARALADDERQGFGEFADRAEIAFAMRT